MRLQIPSGGVPTPSTTSSQVNSVQNQYGSAFCGAGPTTIHTTVQLTQTLNPTKSLASQCAALQGQLIGQVATGPCAMKTVSNPSAPAPSPSGSSSDNNVAL